MIDRNTPNKNIAMNIHGLFQDYKLMKLNLHSQIITYLDKTLGKNIITDIGGMNVFCDYNEKTNSLSVQIKLKEFLEDDQVRSFCDEFDLKLKDIYVIYDNFKILELPSDTNLNDYKYAWIKYNFIRKQFLKNLYI